MFRQHYWNNVCLKLGENFARLPQPKFPARWSSFLDACLTTSIYSEIRINLKLTVNYHDWAIERIKKHSDLIFTTLNSLYIVFHFLSITSVIVLIFNCSIKTVSKKLINYRETHKLKKLPKENSQPMCLMCLYSVSECPKLCSNLPRI